jgi:NAD(P)-dependent dehydrogenase (short-subunit alcohol dehydrogenase family)
VDEQIVVVGAAGGIGSAIIRRALADDYAVFLIDRDAHKLQTLAADLDPVRCRHEVADMLVAAELEQALAAAAAHLPIRAVVNAAGAGPEQVATPIEVLESNLQSAARICELSHSRLQPGGSVVLIGSVGSSTARGDSDGELRHPLDSGWSEAWAAREPDRWEAYYYAKRGVTLLARRLAVEWGPSNRRINVVAPVLVDTQLGHSVIDDAEHGVAEMVAAIPLGRICSPDDVAAAVSFFVSDDAAFVTGVEIRVDGGSTAAGLHARNVES